jgi:hypothetical protein
MKERRFPHVPKSSASLELGDFWSIPLNGDRFACGRVIDRWPSGFKGAQRGFFAGLLDWVSDKPPTVADIAGAQTLIQGGVHLKVIILTGGAILGNRPLELDGITPQLFIEYPNNREAHVYRGMQPIHVASKEEIRTLPTLSIFGFLFMREYGNHHLQTRKPLA